MIEKVFIFIGILEGVLSQTNPCFQSSCYPATGDLLIGRESRLKATSTCGLDRPENYCIVSHLEDSTKCFTCDSREPYVRGLYQDSHRVENIVSSKYLGRKESWWQAKNGMENVSIQLDLEAEFHFTHLIMTFKTFRPSAMFVERSYDFGKTWKIYRYFAYDCASSFPGVPTGPIRNLNDVICENRYSDVAPSTEGEVIMKVVPPSIVIKDPYSESVQDLLKMTNLRVNFTKLHTLGDILLDSRPEIKSKYYYAMYEMVVRGSCSCYGHASRCVPIPGFDGTSDMVHGKCECTHNTKGLNCEECEDFYNDLPWGPARGLESNECKKCECNNHATRCHFDPAVYEATGRVSGGVCDDCQHNTMGRNCQECKPFFYQDPAKDIRDPDVCTPCDCDPKGSEYQGECESRTDEVHNLVAGRCFCKRFVDGKRCDTCRNGYWNLRADSPEGCEPCTCNTLGTVGNYGCDKQTGVCTCKRFVTGRNCDQCLRGYWGLSQDPNGCKPCDCDFGGSLDGECDVITGQCKCRDNIIGRRCDKPRPGFFITNLDYLIYEAEFAKGIGNTKVVIREPILGRPVTWTGPGFMRVTEGDTLEFTVDNLPASMEYDIVIRYEPQMPDRWEDVRVTVQRPQSIDQTTICANSIPQDDLKATSLPAGSRYYTVSPSSCLETGVTYKILLYFNRYKSDQTTADATALIDSIVLVPRVGSMQQVPQNIIADLDNYRCRDNQLAVVRPDLAEICKGYLFSVGAIIHDKALDCNCDPTGSVSAVCDPSGGQCQCKPNVIGRRCDKCAPGHYGFGPQGCTACNCNVYGSRDNFCHEDSGQCWCIPNTYGRMCDQCQRGFFNFPNCRQCQCNGKADTCEDKTGRCIDCRDFTAGFYCDECARGYFGDPRIGIDCRPCACPGGVGSGYQHADTCRLSPNQRDAICDCRAGYAGERCDRCAENFYGNPLIPGGFCSACICNNNIDVNVPGSCDATTGECLKCLYNTEGYACEHCTAGYYGDATRQDCQACVCNILGTDSTQGNCDRRTGQCPCLPNVIGRACDRCAPDHWKIASGAGCETCNCDPEGSLSTQCNEFDGQCPCKPRRGGRTCSECEANYWGDPTVGCYECNCNYEGSETLQCDRRTGQCVCLPGVDGTKCDRCKRGTTGQLPNCVPCGECFDNWDRIIQDLMSRTRTLIDEANQVQIQGVSKAYEHVFRDMEKKLQEVKDIIANANVSVTDVSDLQKKLDAIKIDLETSATDLAVVDGDVTDTSEELVLANNRLDGLRRGIEGLQKSAEDLRKEAEELKEQNVQGAFESILASQNRSQDAQDKVDNTDNIIKESTNVRAEVEKYLKDNQADFENKMQENNAALGAVENDVKELEDKLADVNELVCDGRGAPCDTLCGGGGCDKCGVKGGGQSCDGAVSQAANSLGLAKQAEEIINKKTTDVEKMLTDVQSADDLANMAKDDVTKAYNKALLAKNVSENARADLAALLDEITDFLTAGGARAQEIRQVAEEVLAMSIPLTKEEIEDLAQQIKQAVEGLTNIDEILDATKGMNATAHNLKEQAQNASAAAEAILQTAKRVTDQLALAEEAQLKAQQAISTADENIENAETYLTQVESETEAAVGKANSSLNRVKDLTDKLNDVKRKYTENELKVQLAQSEADTASSLAEQAELDANQLEGKYKDASAQLENKFNMTTEAKERAEKLRERAKKLAQNTEDKLRKLKGMETEFQTNEKTLTDLSAQIASLNEQMKKLNEKIQEKADYFRTCQP